MPVEPVLRGHMTTLFETYAGHTGLAVSTVSHRVHGDARFYDALKAKTSTFTAYAYDKVVAEFAHIWPAALPWPEGIEKIDLSEIRERPRKPRRKPGSRPSRQRRKNATTA